MRGMARIEVPGAQAAGAARLIGWLMADLVTVLVLGLVTGAVIGMAAALLAG